MNLIRAVESSSIDELERLIPRRFQETEREFRLRIMNLLVPGMEKDFALYLEEDEELKIWYLARHDFLVTRLFAVTERCFLKENVDIFIEFLLTYTYDFLINVFRKTVNKNQPFISDFTFALSRAIYRFNRKFYIEFEDLYYDLNDYIWSPMSSGVIYESVLNNDFDTLDNITNINSDFYKALYIAKASIQAGNNKVFIDYINKLMSRGRDKYDVYHSIILGIGSGDTAVLVQTIKAISEQSGLLLGMILEFIINDFQFGKNSQSADRRNIYDAFVIAGLPAVEIVNIVESFPEPRPSEYIKWKDTFFRADV